MRNILVSRLNSNSEEGRINAPATLSNNNWSYRFTKKIFNENKDRIAEFLSKNAIKYHRDWL